MFKTKDLTQRLAEQEQWKARNNLKTTNFVEFKNVIKFLIPSQEERRHVSKEWNWKVADWWDLNDHDVGENK
tara:strand:+ start:292 stop:507 length:216 start_codon:yes stop_codon:yes gene_type:complete